MMLTLMLMRWRLRVERTLRQQTDVFTVDNRVALGQRGSHYGCRRRMRRREGGKAMITTRCTVIALLACHTSDNVSGLRSGLHSCP